MKCILLQLDTDPHPSVFDRVVAIDAGAEELFSYGRVTPENVTALVHGVMFTRGPNDLKNTAIFIGGSSVAAGEELAKKVLKTFFGPVRVSVMMDPNGSNTTAAAAVLAAGKHLPLHGAHSVVLGGTGPVGQRAAQLLAMQKAKVHVASRSVERAQAACETIRKAVSGADVQPAGIGSDDELKRACDGAALIIAAGAAGVQFLSAERRQSLTALKVTIDLNAVPPLGLEGIEVSDKAKERDGVICYGAIGVGGTKMKIHRAAIARLFESNDQVLDTAAIFRIGEGIT
jgi:hypothetical protein